MLQKGNMGTSLVVQGLRIRLPVQETRVRSLVEELRSHVPGGGKVRTPQLERPQGKIQHAATKTQCSQINK